jgi:hypothetical protein
LNSTVDAAVSTLLFFAEQVVEVERAWRKKDRADDTSKFPSDERVNHGRVIHYIVLFIRYVSTLLVLFRSVVGGACRIQIQASRVFVAGGGTVRTTNNPPKGKHNEKKIQKRVAIIAHFWNMYPVIFS